MNEIEVYNPFNVKEYYIVSKEGKKFFNYDNLLLELCPNGYIPKSGLLFDNVLNFNICGGKDVLDLGCGYLGILSIISKINGASSIDSIDYDDECIKWFSKIIKENNLKNIDCFKSDYFKNIQKKYDLILSNPPQLPMISGGLHDSGGYDGRQYILEIMKESINHLNDEGVLYILMFDFIGTFIKTNNNKSILEIARDIGYNSIDLVFEITKKIKKGSVTYNNISYINSIYPLYDFGKDDKTCKIQILKMKR